MCQSFIVAIDAIKTTISIQEALKDENWALEKNSTWEIVDRSKGKRAQDWLLKGYIDTYGIDYEEIIFPVAKMNTIRVILSLAIHFGWNLQQFDVKKASLHGDLKEEVYMEIPPRFYSHNEKKQGRQTQKGIIWT
ncbi:hypothetical protein CR513_32173, partial [Mucuna pruriens]